MGGTSAWTSRAAQLLPPASLAHISVGRSPRETRDSFLASFRPSFATSFPLVHFSREGGRERRLQTLPVSCSLFPEGSSFGSRLYRGEGKQRTYTRITCGAHMFVASVECKKYSSMDSITSFSSPGNSENHVSLAIVHYAYLRQKRIKNLSYV